MCFQRDMDHAKAKKVIEDLQYLSKREALGFSCRQKTRTGGTEKPHRKGSDVLWDERDKIS